MVYVIPYVKRSDIIKNKHLTPSDRAEIEIGLKLKKSLTEIGRNIGKSSNTIKHEIKTHREIRYPSTFNGKRNLCKHFKDNSCEITNLCHIDGCTELCKNCKRHYCNELCKNYDEYLCDSLINKPYCCNGCDFIKKCHEIKMYYYAKNAEIEYRDKLSSSRKGCNITKEEIDYINENVKPRILNGQSFTNILISDKNINKSVSSLYNYTEAGIFEFKNIDLPKKSSVQAAKKRKE